MTCEGYPLGIEYSENNNLFLKKRLDTHLTY